MIGYGLFRTKGARVNHIYGPAKPVEECGVFVPLQSLCGRWAAGKAYKAWASTYLDKPTPDLVEDSVLNRKTCAACKEASRAGR